MRIVRFEPAHLEALRLQPAQAAMAPDLTPDYARALAAQPAAFTALGDDGDVLAVCGCVERWPGCAVAWALVSCDAGREMRALVRAMRGYFDHAVPWRRVEAYVDAGFDAGDRLAELLGFEREARARAFRPDGGDATIWVKIQPSS